MRPGWFSIPFHQNPTDDPPIPFELMWDVDQHWFPYLISGVPFSARVDYTRDEDVFTLQKWWIGINP
jgi:8-oxo-dGTP diphosphatase/2-hydroxy-dATP diphosphatase